MRVLLTGASGLLGRAVFRELGQFSSISLLGTAFTRAGEGLVKLDLRDRHAVEAFIKQEKPDSIIHCAAERRPDQCEGDPEGTMLLNVEATRILAQCAKELDIWLLYMSTDYVFDGSQPPYGPEDRPNPLNLYGKSKLLGENALKAAIEKYAVLRVPVLYGRAEFLEESPVTLIAKEVLTAEPKRYDNWAVRYPTHVDDVAVVIRKMIERGIEDYPLLGTFHWSSDEPSSKFRIASVIAKIAGLPLENIVPQDTPPSGASRPRDSHLDCEKLEKLRISARTPFAEGIAEALRPFITGI